MNPDELIRSYEVPDHKGVFVVGCGQRRRRITIRDQQIRAVNLIGALVRSKRLKKLDYLTVVGAGFAGLTAAAAAASVGARVRVVDERASPLSLQFGCSQRWLHPNIYDWPDAGSNGPSADQLFLNWYAASAKNVVEAVRRRWEEIVGAKSIQQSLDTIVTGLRAEGTSWVLETQPDQAAIEQEPCKFVVLAVGFGLEKDLGQRRTFSYWENDNLDRYPLRGRDTEKFVIVGSGDGALIDTLRAKMTDFQHENMLEDFALMSPEMEPTRSKIVEIEKEARERETRGESPEDYLRTEYKRLTSTTPVDDVLKRRASKQTEVELVTQSGFYSLKSTALNRFMVSRLVQLELVSQRQGTLVSVENSEDGRCAVAVFEDGMRLDDLYDVCARIGPKSALRAHLRSIAELCDRMPRVDEPDPTTHRYAWPELPGRITTTVPVPKSKSTCAYLPVSSIEFGEILSIGLSAIPRRHWEFSPSQPHYLRLRVDRGTALAVAKANFGEGGGVVELRVQGEGSHQGHASAPIRFEKSRGVAFILVEDIKYVTIVEQPVEQKS